MAIFALAPDAEAPRVRLVDEPGTMRDPLPVDELVERIHRGVRETAIPRIIRPRVTSTDALRRDLSLSNDDVLHSLQTVCQGWKGTTNKIVRFQLRPGPLARN